MKKITLPALLLGFTFIVACGPSAEEKAVAEQKMKDSIAEVERLKAEEMMAIQLQHIEDSLALVEAERIAAEEAAAAAKPGKPKPKATTPPVEEKPKEKPKSLKDAMGGDSKGDTKTDDKPKGIRDAIKEPK